MIRTKFIGAIALLLVALSASAVISLADHGPSRDPLGILKRAITAANAPALTAQQEVDLNTLITAFKAAQPTEPDTVLEAARDAYDAAILAGNLAASQTAATAIAARLAQLSEARLKAEAQFEITVLANLQTGGQLAPLRAKYDDERVLDIVGSLAGRDGPGGPGGGGRRGR
ncbi:MAG: hypothetical protein ACKVX9_21700 [Blastocatellia bacterium]